jgi:hypothetical protein
MNQCTKPIPKMIKSNNYCYQKVEGAIVIWRVMENTPILLMEK